ncbi:hypothetical protein CF5_0067 [Staphylococcus phage CF5]|uniref:Virion component n=1 Tax=Staphylococcus phage CF5 TaxID=3113739 RepID=A0AAX4J754_9CAUD|nr:hypothetical protein CF5_0067 [Staphylococcus phage CF5]
MSKYIEITMQSGNKFYLVSTDDKNYVRQDIDYMLSGSSGMSIKVNTSSDINSGVTYINPAKIESFKIIF